MKLFDPMVYVSNLLTVNMSFLSVYCQAPLKVGPCRAAFPRWHYNAATGSCESFRFGGCNGNNNNFLSNDTCLSACSGVTGITPDRTPDRKHSTPDSKLCFSF